MKNSKLSPEARKLWKEITAQWDLEPDAMAILQQACEALDEVRRAQETLEKEGRVVKDRFGQPKQHPECLNLRDARAAFLKSLRQLNLEPDRVGAQRIGTARRQPRFFRSSHRPVLPSPHLCGRGTLRRRGKSARMKDSSHSAQACKLDASGEHSEADRVLRAAGVKERVIRLRREHLEKEK